MSRIKLELYLRRIPGHSTSQHSSGTCETVSLFPKGIISLIFGRREAWFPVGTINISKPRLAPGFLCPYSEALVRHLKVHTSFPSHSYSGYSPHHPTPPTPLVLHLLLSCYHHYPPLPATMLSPLSQVTVVISSLLLLLSALSGQKPLIMDWSCWQFLRCVPSCTLPCSCPVLRMRGQHLMVSGSPLGSASLEDWPEAGPSIHSSLPEGSSFLWNPLL